MSSLRYYDEGAARELFCGSGGANVPALNGLLAPFGIAFASAVFHGNYLVAGRTVSHNSGSALVRFPKGGQLLSVPLKLISAEAAASPQQAQVAPLAYTGELLRARKPPAF